ncbi:MAG: hypothetical protein MK171_10965 [Pirellulales bacterium]|nr:hypothetical protein [Pirellulales bacterium]
MMRLSNRRRPNGLAVALAIATIWLWQSWAIFPAQAGFVSFNGMTQSGQGPSDPPTPFGAPTIAGNSLIFVGPSAFAATSANGDFDIMDSFTDGRISFSVEADDDTWITGMRFKDVGLRNLLEILPGSGTAATRVRVIALGSISVTELDHGNTPLTAAAAQPMDIGFDLSWNFDTNPEVALWTGMDERDIEDELNARGVAFDNGATAFDFFMNNQLLAISEQDTFAFIDKKRVDFEVYTDMIVPEPGTLLFGWMAAFAVATGRFRVQVGEPRKIQDPAVRA